MENENQSIVDYFKNLLKLLKCSTVHYESTEMRSTAVAVLNSTESLCVKTQVLSCPVMTLKALKIQLRHEKRRCSSAAQWIRLLGRRHHGGVVAQVVS